MSCSADNRTGLAIETSLKSPNTPFEIAVTGTSASKTITITVDHAGYWLFRLWLVDSATTPGSKTLFPPSGSDVAEWYEVTNSSGVLTKTITHSGTRSWYVCATLVGPVSVSDVLAFS
jgi:hypothetical protein